MTIDRAKLAKLATITLRVDAEDIEIEGNASAIGPEEDAVTARWIRDQLDQGNVWAWCHVTVTASYAGFEGHDGLGACSYQSESDFKHEGGYYNDMVREALARLAAELESADATLTEVRS